MNYVLFFGHKSKKLKNRNYSVEFISKISKDLTVINGIDYNFRITSGDFIMDSKIYHWTYDDKHDNLIYYVITPKREKFVIRTDRFYGTIGNLLSIRRIK